MVDCTFGCIRWCFDARRWRACEYVTVLTCLLRCCGKVRLNSLCRIVGVSVLFSPLELSGGVSSVGSGLVSGCARSGVRVTDVLRMYCRAEPRAPRPAGRKPQSPTNGQATQAGAIPRTGQTTPPHSHSPGPDPRPAGPLYSAGGSPPSRAECRDPADRSRSSLERRARHRRERGTGERTGDGEGPAPP